MGVIKKNRLVAKRLFCCISYAMRRMNESENETNECPCHPCSAVLRNRAEALLLQRLIFPRRSVKHKVHKYSFFFICELIFYACWSSFVFKDELSAPFFSLDELNSTATTHFLFFKNSTIAKRLLKIQ